MTIPWIKQLGVLVILVVICGGWVSFAHAVSPPNIMTYQGRLLNANGFPVADTSLGMSFAFYTALTGGTCLWSNSSASCATTTARTVALSSGLFTENLGDTSNSYAAIGDSLFADNATVYLEVVIAGETLSPRRQVTTVPYALNADTLDGIDSTVLQLFETGSSRTFEDDAPVIVGTNAAFTYGSAGVGDLRVEDELEVMGDGYIDNDLVVGASTSSTETITNAGFTLGGDDLFVAGTLGVEGTIFTDGALDVVGTATVGDLACTDCLDFSEFADAMSLDASTTVTLDGSESLTFANGSSGNIIFNLASTGDFVLQDNGTAVFSVSDTGVTSIDPTTTGTILDFELATQWTAGDLINIDWDSATTQSASMRSLDIDMTNVTGGSGLVVEGVRTILPAVTASGTTATLFTAFFVDQSGGLNTTDSAVSTISWSGFRIDMPDINTGDASDTVTSRGIEIIAGTVTNGPGTEDQIGIDVAGTKLELDADNDTSLIASVDDRIDWELGGTAQTLIMSAPASASSGSTTPILEINYATPADASGTNIHQGLFLDLSLGNASGGTNTVTGLAFDDITGDAEVANLHAIDIGTFTGSGASNETAIEIGSGWDAEISFLDGTQANIRIPNSSSIAFQDGTNTLMRLADNGTNGILTIDNLSTSASAVNIYDVAVAKTIDIGSVDTDSTDTINIGTNAVSADTISLGNTHASTNVSLTAGSLIDLEGTVNIDLVAIGATQFAVCHTNADTNDEPIGDCSGAPTADYAEQYPVAEGIEYGDIVVPGTREVITDDGTTIVELVKSSQAYQGPIVGIVSNNYGDFTSAGYNIEEADNPMPVALVGRVPVNVTDEGGDISVGDYLAASSSAGKAMKATKAGRIIGMALEDWDGMSATIMVQVNNSWSMGEVLGSDGTSTLVTDNVVVSSVGTAVDGTSFDSYGLALRGSAWNGSEAETVEMMLQNVVDDQDQYRLSIRNTTETEIAYITNEGTMKIVGDMVIGRYLYPSDRGMPQTEKYIYYDGSSGTGGDFMRTNAKGWSTGSYDFAEMFPSDEELVSGDVVVFAGSGETVQRATGSQEERLAGIVSTRPGFLAGENVDGAYPIALAGRVPTKVSVENGEIVVGDPLTASSASGVAMKANDAGQIIGYALESYTGSESDNLILAYVNVGYWSGGPQTISIMQNAASETPENTQAYSGLNMSGNIYMATNQILSIGRLEGVSGIWSIEPDGTIRTEASLKTVTESYQGTDVETIAVTSPESVITLTGTSTLVEGQAEVRFEDVVPEFNDVISAIAPIRVIVTPSGPVSLYVSEKDQNHFIVQRFVGSADVEFDWMVTGYRKGFEPLPPVIPSASEGSPSEETELSGDPSSTDETRQDDTDVQEPVDQEPVVEEESASPESPDETLIDSSTEDDGGQAVEPSDVVIEQPSTTEL